MGKIKYKKLLTASVLFGTAAFSFGTLVACAPNNNLVQNITTYSTNDVHGRMDLETYDENHTGQKSAGLESIAGYLQTYNNYDLLLDAGDLIQGNALTNFDQGKTIFDVINRMKYDAIAVGNHEFDFGYPYLLELNNTGTNTKFIAANIKYENTDKYMFEQQHVIKKIKNNLTVGITAVTTQETKFTTHPKNVEGIEFTDVVEETKREVNEMKKEGAQMIVVLSHTGEEDATRIAKELGDDVDLIIDGHSHIRYEKQVNNTWIVQTGSYADGLRRSTFNFNKKTNNIENFKTEVLSYETLAAENAKAPQEIKDEISELTEKLNKEMSKVVIEDLPYALNGERTKVRFEETNLGDFAADAIFYKGQKITSDLDFAFVNSGGIRTTIQQGQVTKQDVFDVFPFSNDLVTVTVPGQKIFEAFQWSIQRIGEGSMFQVSDQLKIKTREETNKDGTRKRVLDKVLIKNKDSTKNATEDGYTDLDLNKEYKVATLDFITAGGDGYSMLDYSNAENGLKDKQTIGLDLTALQEYLEYVYKNKEKDDPLVKKYETIQNRLDYKKNGSSSTY